MNKNEAILIAKKIAEEKGWTWLDSVRVKKFRKWFVGDIYWKVSTNYECKGLTIRIIIHDKTGEVREKYYAPR